jgi:hypothetical protein
MVVVMKNQLVHGRGIGQQALLVEQWRSDTAGQNDHGLEFCVRYSATETPAFLPRFSKDTTRSINAPIIIGLMSENDD